jgi:hypothetical protein
MIFDLTFFVCVVLFILVAAFLGSVFYISLDVERARTTALAHPETLRKAWFEEFDEEGHLALGVEFTDGTKHLVAGPFPFHLNEVYAQLKEAGVKVENVPEPLSNGSKLEYSSLDDEVDEMLDSPFSRFQSIVVTPLLLGSVIIGTVYCGIERHLGHVLN